MKNLKKLAVLSLTALAVTACSGNGAKYERAEDDDIYAAVLPEYEALVQAAKDEPNESKKFAKYAQAEAYLMDSGLVLTTTSQGGAYAVTRMAPRTIPYVSWGNDEYKYKYGVAIAYDANHKFITADERDDLKALWATARSGGAAYDPAAYLTGKGYAIDTVYRSYMTSNPETFDVLATSKARDSQYLVNGVEGLLEYDNLGNLGLRLASNVELSEDKKTYTFTVKSGEKWVNNQGQVIAEVTADDFVAGFQHMLDTKGGLQNLVKGVVKGVTEYLKGEVTFDKVGVKAEGNQVSYELVAPESFFLTRFSYTCFHPMNRQYYLDQGGKFGSEFDKTASTYNYGKKPDQILYNGAYYINDFTKDTKIELTKNPQYTYQADKINFAKLSFAFDGLDNRNNSLQKAIDGDYNSWSLTSAVIDKAKEGGANSIYNLYAYVTDTNAVTFFGGMNVNRGTFEVGSVASAKDDNEKVKTHDALLNANFRRAIQQAWDRETWNAVSVGEELATVAMRNMYTSPDFVKTSEPVTIGEKTFPANTDYGDFVQYFLKNTYGRKCDISDGQDGWYHPGEAFKFMKKAKAELEAEGKWNGKVQLEVVYNGQDEEDIKSKKAFETVIEELLGDYVDVVCLAAANEEDQLNTDYNTEAGEEACYDISWNSGWGPDYGDPSTYIDTFLSGGVG